MPSYNVKNRTTGEVTVQIMRIAEMEELVRTDPNIDIIPGVVGIGDGQMSTYMKSERHGKFKDLITDIKRRNPGNTIDGTGL